MFFKLKGADPFFGNTVVNWGGLIICITLSNVGSNPIEKDKEVHQNKKTINWIVILGNGGICLWGKLIF